LEKVKKQLKDIAEAYSKGAHVTYEDFAEKLKAKISDLEKLKGGGVPPADLEKQIKEEVKKQVEELKKDLYADLVSKLAKLKGDLSTEAMNLITQNLHQTVEFYVNAHMSNMAKNTPSPNAMDNKSIMETLNEIKKLLSESKPSSVKLLEQINKFDLTVLTSTEKTALISILKPSSKFSAAEEAKFTRLIEGAANRLDKNNSDFNELPDLNKWLIKDSFYSIAAALNEINIKSLYSYDDSSMAKLEILKELVGDIADANKSPYAKIITETNAFDQLIKAIDASYLSFSDHNHLSDSFKYDLDLNNILERGLKKESDKGLIDKYSKNITDASSIFNNYNRLKPATIDNFKTEIAKFIGKQPADAKDITLKFFVNSTKTENSAKELVRKDFSKNLEEFINNKGGTKKIDISNFKTIDKNNAKTDEEKTKKTVQEKLEKIGFISENIPVGTSIKYLDMFNKVIDDLLVYVDPMKLKSITAIIKTELSNKGPVSDENKIILEKFILDLDKTTKETLIKERDADKDSVGASASDNFNKLNKTIQTIDARIKNLETDIEGKIIPTVNTTDPAKGNLVELSANLKKLISFNDHVNDKSKIEAVLESIKKTLPDNTPATKADLSAKLDEMLKEDVYSTKYFGLKLAIEDYVQKQDAAATLTQYADFINKDILLTSVQYFCSKAINAVKGDTTDLFAKDTTLSGFIKSHTASFKTSKDANLKEIATRVDKIVDTFDNKAVTTQDTKKLLKQCSDMANEAIKYLDTINDPSNKAHWEDVKIYLDHSKEVFDPILDHASSLKPGEKDTITGHIHEVTHTSTNEIQLNADLKQYEMNAFEKAGWI